MTNVAYLLITIVACVLGIGVGLIVHHFWDHLRGYFGKSPEPASTPSDDESQYWDVYSKWQAENNRRFATQVISCGAAPILLATLAWGERSDVVKTVCEAVTKVAGQAYICM